MKGVNKWIGIGNVGREPEMRTTQSGTQVVNMSIACNDEWYDKQAGHKKDRTEWVRLVVFGKLAEIAGKYVNKGTQLYVEGRMQTRKWQDKSGIDRYTTEVVVSQMNMLGGKQTTQQSHQQNDDFDSDIPF